MPNSKHSESWYKTHPNPKSTPKEIDGHHGHTPHGPSILWPALYEHLREKGKTKEAAARISHAAWKKKRVGMKTNTPTSVRGVAKSMPDAKDVHVEAPMHPGRVRECSECGKRYRGKSCPHCGGNKETVKKMLNDDFKFAGIEKVDPRRSAAAKKAWLTRHQRYGKKAEELMAAARAMPGGGRFGIPDPRTKKGKAQRLAYRIQNQARVAQEKAEAAEGKGPDDRGDWAKAVRPYTKLVREKGKKRSAREVQDVADHLAQIKEKRNDPKRKADRDRVRRAAGSADGKGDWRVKWDAENINARHKEAMKKVNARRKAKGLPPKKVPAPYNLSGEKHRGDVTIRPNPDSPARDAKDAARRVRNGLTKKQARSVARQVAARRKPASSAQSAVRRSIKRSKRSG